MSGGERRLELQECQIQKSRFKFVNVRRTEAVTLCFSWEYCEGAVLQTRSTEQKVPNRI